MGSQNAAIWVTIEAFGAKVGALGARVGARTVQRRPKALQDQKCKLEVSFWDPFEDQKCSHLGHDKGLRDQGRGLGGRGGRQEDPGEDPDAAGKDLDAPGLDFGTPKTSPFEA